MRKNEKITALYERLSRDDFGKDDDQQRESNSISNQKAMLEEFAARQGFTNIVHFTEMKTPSLIQFNDLRRLAGRGGKLRGQGG